MQSAAKCPIMVTFNCRKYPGPDKYFKKKMKERMQEVKKRQISDCRV